MKRKKATKGTKKAKVRDLPTKKGATAGVKGGATSSIVDLKNTLQSGTCWLVGPTDSTLRG